MGTFSKNQGLSGKRQNVVQERHVYKYAAQEGSVGRQPRHRLPARAQEENISGTSANGTGKTTTVATSWQLV